MLHWSQEAFVSALALSLLHSLWQGALAGLLILALNPRLRRATPDVRCGAYSLLLFTVFALWLGTFCSLYGAQTRPTVISGGMGVIAHMPSPPAPSFVITGSSATGSLLHSLAPFLVAGWALGVCALSLKHFGGLLLLNRLSRMDTTPCPPEWEACAKRLAARMGIRRRIRLQCSSRIDIPFAFGVFRSSILLPVSAMTGLDSAQVEALIAHELAHFARHDVLLNLFQVCMETVLFYHPVVRWLSAQIRAAREQHCDDLAIQVLGDRTLYARALFSLEEARASTPHLALGAKGDHSDMTNTHLLRRIRRVLGVSTPERRDPWAKGALALGAAAIGLAALLPIHAYSQSSGPSAADPAPTPTITSHVSTKVVLNINGDKIELSTIHPTEDTPVTVNGKMGRYGDLTQIQQKQLHDALLAVPSHIHVKSFVSGSAPNGSSAPSIHITSSTKILMDINGDKIELNTTDPTANTPVTVNGVKGRFGDLTQIQQKQLHDHLQGMHIRVSMSGDPGTLPADVLGQVRSALQGADLPEDIKVQVMENVTAHGTDDSHGTPKP